MPKLTRRRLAVPFAGDDTAAWDGNAPSRHRELYVRDDPAYRALSNRVLAFLRDNAQTGQRVLDAGAGIGSLSAEIHSAGWDVVAIDPSLASIEIARKFYPGPHYEVSSLEGYRAEGQFAAIIANMTLHSVENIQGFLSAASALLTPEGSMFVTIPNPLTYLQTRTDIDTSELNLRSEQTLEIPFRIRDHEPHPHLVRFYHRPVRSYSVAAQNAGMRIDDFDIPLHVGPGRARDITVMSLRHLGTVNRLPADH